MIVDAVFNESIVSDSLELLAKLGRVPTFV